MQEHPYRGADGAVVSMDFFSSNFGYLLISYWEGYININTYMKVNPPPIKLS
jgi:hypothetical protein